MKNYHRFVAILLASTLIYNVGNYVFNLVNLLPSEKKQEGSYVVTDWESRLVAVTWECHAVCWLCQKKAPKNEDDRFLGRQGSDGGSAHL
jgi:hypothetical protein